MKLLVWSEEEGSGPGIRQGRLITGVHDGAGRLRSPWKSRLASEWVIEHAHAPAVLLAAIVAVSGVFSVFFVNDTMCLVLTPLVLEITRSLRRNPVPYLLAVAMASNIGSVATITGNPQNMMIGSFSGIHYRPFSATLAQVAAAGLLTAIGTIALIYRREFGHTPPLEVKRRAVCINRALLAKSVAAAAAIFFAGWPVPKVALVAGALLALFVGLFIVVAGVEKTSLTTEVFKPLIPHLQNPARAWMAPAMSST